MLKRVFAARKLAALLVFLGLAFFVRFSGAKERIFEEFHNSKSQLRYVNDIPVVTFSGTPTEIGAQHAKLLGEDWEPLREFAFGFLGFGDDDVRWKMLESAGASLYANAAQHHQEELRALKKVAKKNGSVVEVINAIPELRRFGCSTLIVEADRSQTGGPLFGRNLDFPTLGILDKHGLVMVFQGKGKRPFASVALPGVLGVLSGMNDAGLAVATLDSYEAADGSAGFNLKGVPIGFLFRQILEECSSVDDAEKLLKKHKATTWMNLSVCDKEGGAVFEITPNQVVRRNAEEGILPCTNHFRTQPLKVNTYCNRYEILSGAVSKPKLDIEQVQGYIHAANQGAMTFQTMVFEPRELALHLAMGNPPSSALPLQRLDLKKLFELED